MFNNALNDFDLFEHWKEIFNNRRPKYKPGDHVELDVGQLDSLSMVKSYIKGNAGYSLGSTISLLTGNHYETMRKGRISAEINSIQWKFYCGDRVEFFYTVKFGFDNWEEIFLVDRIPEQTLSYTTIDPYKNQFLPSPRLAFITYHYEDGTIEKNCCRSAIDAARKEFGL